MARHRATSLVALLLVTAVVGPAVATGGFAHASNDDLVHASNDDLVHASNDDLVHTSNDSFAHTSNDGFAHASNDGSVHASTDGLAEFTLKPGGTIARPGETLRLVVFLRSSPQVASGAYEAGFVLEFDTAALRATNVTRGRFMSQGENTTVRTNVSAVDNDAGVVRFGLERDPPNGGVTGYARFATVTFEVREDALEGRYEVAFRRTRVLLTDGGYQRVTTYGATVSVAEAATTTPTATGTATGPTGGFADAAVGLLALVATLGSLAVVVVLVRRA